MRGLGLPAALLVAACAAPACPPAGGSPMRVYDLYFGRAIKGRAPLTAAEWRTFRDQVVTPALPDGYTVLTGEGAWRGPAGGATVTEDTIVLIAALPDTPASLTAINRVRSAYQHQFNQESVGMAAMSGCGSFTKADSPP